MTEELRVSGLVAVLIGAALAPVDLFVVNVALPAIRADLGAAPATLEWVVAAYGLTFALLLVVGGRLGDALGRRRVFVAGLVAFTLTSLACGLAPNAELLVAARAAQGAAAAMVAPQALSLIQATTSGSRRARALGCYGATGGIAMVAGQLLGGVLVTADLGGTGWRPAFAVNVPIGIAAVVLARRFVPESRAEHPPGPDLAGTALLGATLVAVLVPLLEGGGLGWPPWCVVLLALAPAGAVALACVERGVERAGGTPLLPPSVLRLAPMRVGLAVLVPFFAVFGGFLFVQALLYQDALHLSALDTGIALTPLGGSMLVLSLLADRMVARWGRRVVTAGAVLLTLGPLLVAGSAAVVGPRPAWLVPGTLLFGIGFGLVSPTLFRIVLSGVEPGRAGVGSGALTTGQQVAVALGVATLGTLFTTLRGPDGASTGTALIVVSAVQAAVAVGLGLVSLRLPDPRAQPASLPASR